MPQNTTRGYPFPCYSDNTDFPDDLGDLATAVDTDVQSLVTALSGAKNRVSGSFTAVGPISIPNNVETAITLTGEIFDTGAFGTVPTANLTIPTTGLYLFSFRGEYTAGDTGDRRLRLRRTTPSNFTIGVTGRQGISLSADMSATTVAPLNAGETFGLLAFQDIGAPLNLSDVVLSVALVSV